MVGKRIVHGHRMTVLRCGVYYPLYLMSVRVAQCYEAVDFVVKF